MNNIVILSDIHFGAGRDSMQREKDFIYFLDKIRGKDLILLGDIFDFWIEYRSAIYKKYFHVLCSIKHFISDGGKVYFVPGNHDFYSTDFFMEIGMIVKGEGITIEWRGKRVFLHHGDVFSFKGKFNRFFYGNPIVRSIFRMFHPDIGIVIASMVSKTSYKRPRKDVVAIPAGVKELFDEYDIIITGHTHTVGVKEIGEGKYYINAGEWLFNRSYVEITSESISVKEWDSILSTIKI